MKLAIISDTHFGDPGSLLVDNSGKLNKTYYDQFVDAAGKHNNYLVLVGDVFDFSVAPYAKAYECGRTFFKKIQSDQVAKKIIYLAGNHDAEIWHTVQYQRNVINTVMRGQPFKQFRHSVAGIIDDRRNAADRGNLILDDVTERPTSEERYGEMFLDSITLEGSKDPKIPPAGTTLNFNFAYPNLYIVTDNECVLVTHGQYLEWAWAFVGELGKVVAEKDLKLAEMNMEKTVEMNFPINLLLCSGLGQAGTLTDVVRQIQQDAKSKNTEKVEEYLDRLKKSKYLPWYVKLYLWFTGREKALLGKIKGIGKTRYNKDFITKEPGRSRFVEFYKSSGFELDDLNKKKRTLESIPKPLRIIYGHTHCPTSWDNPDPGPKESDLPKGLQLSNGGGWIKEGGMFRGAEVFTYETDKPFKSKRIS